MIINASMRTDIPAFFSNWFYNRIKAGYVDVLNPYDKDNKSYYRYALNPFVVDAISFCSKNPEPLISDVRFIKLQEMYPMIWGVTITAYDSSIEPNVPGVQEVLKIFRKLSNMIGVNKVSWRYDPICFLTDKDRYSNMDTHVRCFSYIASELEGFTDKVVISFMDHYNKVSRHTNRVMRPELCDMLTLTEELADIAYEHGMKLYLCHDKIDDLDHKNVVQNNCFSIGEINERLGLNLKRPKQQIVRPGCDCLLGADIGQYNTCDHRCIYCYASGSENILESNLYKHFDKSSCLIGYIPTDAKVVQVKQASWKIGE